MPPRSVQKFVGYDKKLIRVGRSHIGLGIFAKVDIKKNTYVAEYVGPLMTNKECEETRENRYWFEVNSRWTINGVARSNVARYFNHSCRPNSDSMIHDRRIHIKVIKNVKAGEELTYDYGKDYFNAYIKPHGCRCAKCVEKRRVERAEKRATNARKRKRAERKAQANGSRSPR